MRLTGFLCIMLILSVLFTLAGCGKNPSEPETVGQTVASYEEKEIQINPRDYELYRVLYLDDLLYSGPGAYTWDDPNTLHPDFFLYFFSRKTKLHHLSTDAEPIVLPASVVEEYDQLFFSVTSELMRQSNFYLPEEQAYQIPIVSDSPSEAAIDEMSMEENILTVRYTCYYPADHTAFRTGIVRIALPVEGGSRTHQYLSCQVTDLE